MVSIKNKFIIFLLAVIWGCFSCLADEFWKDGFGYTTISEIDNTCELSRSNGSHDGDIVIPTEVYYNGRQYTVIRIGNGAFSSCTTLTSVIIPNTVKEIGDYAFDWCTGLKSVLISDSVSKIGEWAFYGCTSISNIAIPKAVTEIGVAAFARCSSLDIYVANDNSHYCSRDGVLYNKDCSKLHTCFKLNNRDFVVLDSVIEIGAYAFSWRGLESIIIPSSVKKINSYAFYACDFLKRIPIPATIEYIGQNAFSCCYSLSEFLVDQENLNFTSIDGVLFNKDCSKLVAFPNSKCTEYSIPETVTEIGAGAFYNCTSLREVKIPDSVIKIGASAFYWTCFASITIPDSVAEIGNEAFHHCFYLTSLTIPNSVMKIGEQCFSDCDALTSLTIPIYATEIGDEAFAWCDNLKDVYYNCENPIEYNSNIFSGSRQHTILYVPESAVEKCMILNPWKDFWWITAYDFADVGTVKTEIPSERIYNLSGVSVGSDVDKLDPGIYILNKNGKYKKIFVK